MSELLKKIVQKVLKRETVIEPTQGEKTYEMRETEVSKEQIT